MDCSAKGPFNGISKGLLLCFDREENMNIEYLTYNQKPISAKALMELYKDACWWEERKEKDIEQILKLSISVGAWEGQRLIGFARAVSDGKFRAYVEDVIVYKGHQKNGVGKEIVSKLMNELSDIDVVSLFCEKELMDFYKDNGFKPSKSQFVMHKKV